MYIPFSASLSGYSLLIVYVLSGSVQVLVRNLTLMVCVHYEPVRALHTRNYPSASATELSKPYPMAPSLSLSQWTYRQTGNY